MYIYFNNQGVLTTILQHGEPGIRQGSSFDIHVLFEKDCPYIHRDDIDSGVTVMFKKPGERAFGNEMLLERQYDDYKFIALKDENIFDLVDGKEYIHYYYQGTPFDTSKYGTMEGAFTVYIPIPVDVNGDGDANDQVDIPASSFQDTNSNGEVDDSELYADLNGNGEIDDEEKTYNRFRLFTIGLASLYVERFTGEEKKNSVPEDQYTYLIGLINMLQNRITGGTGEIDIDRLRVKRIGDDLIPDPTDTYSIGSAEKRWVALFLQNGTISFDSNGNLMVNNTNFNQEINNLKNEVFGATTTDGLRYIVRTNHENRITRLEDITSILDEVIQNREYLQSQIDSINAAQNLTDIVADLTALANYDTSKLMENDKIQVLSDSNHDNGSTVYNWTGTEFSYIGKYGQDSYTKAESDERFAPRRINLLGGPRSNAANEDVILYGNDGSNNNTPIKVSVAEISNRIITVTENQPINLQVGQFWFKLDEEGND